MNDLIKTVFSLSLSGSVLALLLLLIKAVCRKRLPSVFYYYAWLLVLLRFMIPVPGLLRLEPVEQTPPAAVSQPSQDPDAFPPLPTHPTPQLMNAERRLGQNVQPIAVNTPKPEAESAPVEREQESAPKKQFRFSLTPGQILGGVWALGALAWAGYVLCGYRRFSRGLNRTLRRASAKEWQTFRALGGPNRLRLCRSEAVQTPMQLGVVDARLVLPNRSYTDDMLLNILRHELTHFSRHDIAYKWFTTLVCAVHWFNPLVWIVRREIDRQCELSCDEKLLRSMTPQQKQSYGQTLLALACDRAPSRAVIATSFATEKRNLKERLEQIMTYKSKGWTAAILALCVLLILAGCGAAAGPAGENQTVPPETTVPIASTEASQLSTEPTAVTAPTAKDGVVEVSNVDEFLAAIAPDTTVVLKEGEYNLATAANYPKFDMDNAQNYLDIVDGGTNYYYWYNLFDGYALYINGVQNFTIQAAEGAKVSILAEPRYADVIRFVNSDTVTVRNLIAGHTEEPSECAGAVLAFEGTDNIRVEGCELFGCGTLGVMAWNCENLLATNCKIYDCSLGAVKVDNSYNVQVDGCDIYECRGYEGILSATHSEEVALTNSTIHDNVVSFLVKEENGSKGVYLGGLTVENNVFTDGLYTAQHKPVIFESCEISDSNEIPGGFAATYEYSSYTSSMTAVDRSGKELADDAIRAMTQAQVTWTAQERYMPVVPEAGEDGVIHVSTVDELVAAIAPNTTIYLEPGEYNLTEASDYGGLGGDYYTWGEEFDGFSLVLKGVEGLTIFSDGPDKTSIVTLPRYADVLRLEDCHGVTLKGFNAGHTEEEGYCTGDVLTLLFCSDIVVEDCSLFGCGVYGVNARECTDVQVKDTEIHHCEYDAATLYNCHNVSFINCNIHHNGSNQVVHSGGTNITVNGQRIPDMAS